MYSNHLALTSVASVRISPLLLLTAPIFVEKVLLMALITSKTFLLLPLVASFSRFAHIS